MPGLPPPPPKKKLESVPLLPLLVGLLAVGVLLALVYWKKRPLPEAPVKLPIVESLGIYAIEVTPTPYPMLVGSSSSLLVHLSRQGEPLSAAGLAGSTTHPESHKDLGIPCKEFSPGNYACEFTADRPGEWVIRFTFYDGANQRYIATTLKAK
jgi:hypothetical protein